MSATEHWKPGMGQIWDPGNHKRVGIGLLATDTVYSRDFPSLTHTYLAIELPAVPETVRIPQLKQMPSERWKVVQPLAGEDEMGQPSTP